MASYEVKENIRVDALQFDGTEESAQAIRDAFSYHVWPSYGVEGAFTNSLFVLTSGGVVSALKDHWVLRSENGTLSVYTPNEFAAAFNLVQADPK